MKRRTRVLTVQFHRRNAVLSRRKQYARDVVAAVERDADRAELQPRAALVAQGKGPSWHRLSETIVADQKD